MLLPASAVKAWLMVISKTLSPKNCHQVSTVTVSASRLSYLVQACKIQYLLTSKRSQTVLCVC